MNNAMSTAIEEARAAMAEGEFPFGAVVVNSDGVIISRAHDTVVSNSDPTRHAEIDAVKLAVQASGMNLSGHTLVCTGEPCAMCSTAAWWAGIRNIIVGVTMLELKELIPDSMEEAIGPIEELNKTLKDKLVVTTGIMRKDVLSLWGLSN